MKKTLLNVLSVSSLCLYGFTFVGCGGGSDTAGPAPSQFALDESDAEDGHDHAHDHGHDHPEHGKYGGHMVKLSNEAETEVDFAEDVDLFSVYTYSLEGVSKVQMKTTISGEETVYEFDRTDTPDGTVVFGLQSPELATAVKMGKEAAQTELIITTSDGDLTATYEYHSH